MPRTSAWFLEKTKLPGELRPEWRQGRVSTSADGVRKEDPGEPWRAWRREGRQDARQQQKSLCTGVYRQPHPPQGPGPAPCSRTSPPQDPGPGPPPMLLPLLSPNSHQSLTLVSGTEEREVRSRCAARRQVEERWGRGTASRYTMMEEQLPTHLCEPCSCVNAAAGNGVRHGHPCSPPPPPPAAGAAIQTKQRLFSPSSSSLHPPLPHSCHVLMSHKQ